ncbi:cell wall-binding repeat-containing protein, partial [Romboutsia maritimum]
DATSIASVSANKNMPILLLPANGTDIYDKYIKENDIKKSYIIGQTNAISKDVENKLDNPERIGGIDRNETNAKIISKFYTTDKVNNMFVCKNGMKEESHLIDALSVGSLAAKQNAPVVIVGENLGSAQREVLKSKSAKTITQVGGGCDKVFNEIEKLYK